MGRKNWYAFSGILQRTLSATTEVTGTQYEVVGLPDIQSRVVLLVTSDAAEAQQAKADAQATGNYIHVGINESEATVKVPAQQKGTAFIPLVPIPLFTKPGKVLTTRGFWDVVSTTSPAGNVSNFAFGMTFLPVKSVYKRGDSPNPDDPADIVYQVRDDVDVPDPLIDDVGWFAYDSFVRVTTDVNQDPPFHSKTNKKFPANSVLAVVAAVEVSVDNLQSLRLDFGIRFRVLIEH